MKGKFAGLLSAALLLCLIPITASASDSARSAQPVTPLEITAVPDGDQATVFVRAETGPDKLYQLIAAAYDGEGRLLSTGMKSVGFSPDLSAQTFSIDLDHCARAESYKAFFLAADGSFQPVSAAVSTHDRRAALTSGHPVGNCWQVSYFLPDGPSDRYIIHGLTGQRLDNGYIRLTLDFQGPAGMHILAIDPPDGDLFWLDGGGVTGARQSFAFDLPPEKLRVCDEISILFYSENSEEKYVLVVRPAEVLQEAEARSLLFAVDENGAPYVSYLDVNGVPEDAALSHIYLTAPDGGEAWLGGYAATTNWAKLHCWTLEAGTYQGSQISYLNSQYEEIGSYLSDVKVVVQPVEKQISCSSASYERIDSRCVFTFTGLRPYDSLYTVALYDEAGRNFTQWNDCADASGQLRMEFDASALPDGQIFCEISGNGDFWVSSDGRLMTCTVYQPTERFPVGQPVGDCWSVPYDLWSGPSDQYTIYGLTAQQLSSGYTRFTVEYQGEAGVYIDAFSPPHGELFLLYGGRVDGTRQHFSFDLSPEDISACDEVVIQFYGETEKRYAFSFDPSLRIE